jgi:membrane complex biogenesis BtpA family protein
VAHAAGLEFIRCENFVFAHTADEGVMDRAVAGPLLRHRRAIGAERVAVLADIKKKHAAHALTANLDIAECARGAAFFLADGVVVTGTETGAPVAMDELRRVRAAVALPVVVGSGATPDTVADLLAHADAVIVGSWIKRGGAWTEPVDPDRAAAFVAAARRARTPDGAPAPDRATHRASAQPAAAPTAAPAATPAAPGVDAVRSLFPRR